MNDETLQIAKEHMNDDLTGVTVGKKLEISEVRMLRDRFLEALNAPAARLEVSLAEVEYADTAGLQLLLAFAQEAIIRGKQVGFHGLTEPMRNSLALLGLSGQLG